ncbi:MAG: hypothetical protein IJP62_13900 [Treponema sp.]|nr:hypothetical protein [Treponema sp.]
MSKANGAFESIVLKDRRYTCDAEDEPEVDLNEFDNEVKANSDGTFRTVKTRKVQSISGLNIEIDVDRGDLDHIKELKGSLESFSISATRVDGHVYSGSVMIVGETKYNDKANTMEISLQGKIRML